LRGLDPRNAERVARHLVAAGTLVDEDPALALEHARAARNRAARVAAVREAVGVAAYHAGDYAEAARELRAFRRMSGDAGYRAVLADCERAMGRPEVALRLVAEALADSPDTEELVELRLVEAGARGDLGELPAARLVLEDALGGRPAPETLGTDDSARVRLAAAYADLLDAAGETELAAKWAAAVAAAEPDDEDVLFSEEYLTDEPQDGDTGPDVSDDVEDVDVEDRVEDDEPDLTEDIEAEVAELLGENQPPEDDTRR
jgi:tetratricopeptide (TPR) repeat protein